MFPIFDDIHDIGIYLKDEYCSIHIPMARILSIHEKLMNLLNQLHTRHLEQGHQH